MKRFAQLFNALDATTSTARKVEVMVAYFREVDAADAAWAAYFLAGGRPRQVVPTKLLRALACEEAGIPAWLFEDSYAVTGDLAEAIAYVLPPPSAASHRSLGDWITQEVLPLRGLDPTQQRERVLAAWRTLDADERFLYVKLIGGGFRVGVSRLLVQRALAQVAGIDARLMAQRMMGSTDPDYRPSAERFHALMALDAQPADEGQPYPFFLAHPLTEEAESLGPLQDWQVEWKYDGMRAQVIKRAGRVWIWSRGEDLVTDRFPEIVTLAQGWPDGTVIDGELLAWQAGSPQPAPFALLQTRISRRSLSKKVLAEAPVRLLAYDLLEQAGQDLREQPQYERRERLEALALQLDLDLSPLVQADSWADLAARREQSRERGVEGLMLKQRQSGYGAGRTRHHGLWWKWKISPLTVDALLIYAQAGHGRRANVYTDYTFAVWNRPPRDAEEAAQALARDGEPPTTDALQLVPFAKAYSGLSDAEFRQVDKVIRRTTLERFGPVRKLRPTLMFELGFEGISRSKRHKSGVATRFPRMLRLRGDKPLHEADSMATLLALLNEGPESPESSTDDEGQA